MSSPCCQNKQYSSFHFSSIRQRQTETDFILLLTTSCTNSIRYISDPITNVQAQCWIVTWHGLYLIIRTRIPHTRLTIKACGGNVALVAPGFTFCKQKQSIHLPRTVTDLKKFQIQLIPLHVFNFVLKNMNQFKFVFFALSMKMTCRVWWFLQEKKRCKPNWFIKIQTL